MDSLLYRINMRVRDMQKFLNYDVSEIRGLISNISVSTHYPTSIIEKDMWVSYILDYLFGRCKYRKYFEFKGGTSLSKGYGIINRFSEDLDIVVDAHAYSDKSVNDIMRMETRSQKEKYIRKLKTESTYFLRYILMPIIIEDLRNEINKKLSVEYNEKEMSIYVRYDSLFEDMPYVKRAVKLELGPLAAWTPNEKKLISSFVQNSYPDLCSKVSFPVLITLPKRTFWEKAVILHQEAYRKSGLLPERYARHYYDLYKMYPTQIKKDALADRALLDEVRDFTISFYYRSWSNFECARPGSFRLRPNSQYLAALEDDYKKTTELIFESPKPQFTDIIKCLGYLENEINRL